MTAVLLAAPARATDGRSETKPYAGVIGDLTIQNCNATLPVSSIGGACFGVLPEDAAVTVTIDDLSGRDVGAQLMFRDAANNNLLPSYVFFCSTSPAVPVPAGATRLYVYVDTVFALFDCEDASAVGTMGRITASFTTADTASDRKRPRR